MSRRTHLSAAIALSLLASGLAGCGHVDSEPLTPAPRPTAAFPDIGYADWSDAEPDYRFYPGDEIEITVPSAVELNKTTMVQPDGRVALQLTGPVMGAERPDRGLQAASHQA